MAIKKRQNIRMEVEKLVKNKKFNFVPISLSASERMDVRRESLEKLTGKKLNALKNPVFDCSSVSDKNCENLIGKVEIPLGIAGPLKINGDNAKGDYFIPLATTEGALVASVSRGCKAINESGGAYAYHEKSGMTRAPVFRAESLQKAKEFIDWIEKHTDHIKKLVKKSDRYLSLISIKPYLVGRNVYLRFVFDTGDAMGMNMATFACDDVVRNYIEKKADVRCIALSGNLCTDKKPSWINKIEKRGHSVHAEVHIPEEIVVKILKTTSRDMYEVYVAKILISSSLSGSMAYNAHHANVIAAIFAATGQDLAHVTEASSGTTFVDIDRSGLYFGVSLPDLPLGTVGGGTQLATQEASLSIMGVDGGGNPPGSNAKKFAVITASAVLAGELSLIASLAEGSLAKAHRKLGR